MVKKNSWNKNTKSLFQITLLFLICISFISADIIWVDYDQNEQFGERDIINGARQITLTLNLDNTVLVNYYMKVTVTPKGDIPTPILCFSPTDANCKSNKQAISRVTNGGPAVLLLKKEQFYEGSDELNVLVTCKEDKCNYNIKFEGMQSLEIDTQTSYSYLVTSATREMRFEVIGEAEKKNYLTIGIEGSSSAQINIDGVEKDPYVFDTGRIVTYELKDKVNKTVLSTFSIKGATVGDYITLNVHLISSRFEAPDNLLYPNGPVIMGMLEPKEDLYPEECFPISVIGTDAFKNVNKYYLTGRIHSKYALLWLADEDWQYMEPSDAEISDGQLSYLIENEGKARYVCFEPSYEETVERKTVAYSISILEPTRLEQFYDFYPPQTMNQVYRRMIPKGSYAVFSGGLYDESSKRINFNVYNRKGVTETFVSKCTSYPYCFYDQYTVEEKDKVKIVNKVALYDRPIDEGAGALDEEKKVVIVHCIDDDNQVLGYCEVDTSAYTQGKTITLVENEEFSKYVVKGERGTFKLDLKSSVKIQRLSIDIMIFTGDVTFDVKNQELQSYNNYKYYLSNKIYYHYNLAKTAFESITIDFQAQLNSFFSIKYEIDPSSQIQNSEIIKSGKSYLVQIDPTTAEKTKTIFLQNYRYKKEQPFLANFFALNCDFELKRNGEEIAFFDGYAQEVLMPNTNGYESESYEYNIKITEADLSNYNHKMCMLYVAGYESMDDVSETEVVVGENINQQIIFDDDFKSIRFLYPHANPEHDLAIYVNIIDPGRYHVALFANNNKEAFRLYVITRSEIIYLPQTEIMNYCEANVLCNIIAEATFIEILPGIAKTEPMIEITFRKILNTPTYLQKSHAKIDFTCGDHYYYLYTEIGKNEVGEVSVNFLRDFGNLWGKVVRKDKTDLEEDADWRGVYRMPSEEWEDSFQFNLYTKKFEVNVEDTQDCIEGCYLLLSIQVSQVGEYVNDNKFYPFSIIARVTPSTQAYSDIPKVVIQAGEYIVGSVPVSENERISQFYEIWLPHDSSRIDFDWQSKVAGLYVNVGGIRPTTKNADFNLLPPGRDSILSIDKFDILQKAKAKKINIPNESSLQDLNLVIGVWTDKTDSVDTEIFSLRVHQPQNDQSLDIIEVNTDHKVLCRPHYLQDDTYRCLFMITYDDEDVLLQMPLLVHASSVNQSAVTNMFGAFIVRDDFDEYNYQNLRSKIPTSQSAQYSTLNSGVDYLYTKLVPGRFKYYFFVNVITNLPDDVMIITSLPMYDVLNENDYLFYPNPSSEQLLSVSEESLRLKFFSYSSLIVNIVTLDGEADIMWADAPDIVYNLRGKGDRLSLTSGSQLDEIVLTNKKEVGEDEAGFVFYVSYYIRDGEDNFDEILYGHSLEIGYRDTHLPVFLYSKVGASYTDLNVAVTFKDSDIDIGGVYETSPLIIRAALAKESSVYRAKQSPELAPSFGKTIFGSYDPAIKTAQVFLSADIVASYNIKLQDNPTLYLSIEERNPTQKYSKFNVEAQFTKINSGIVPVEKTFNYGRFISGYMANFYKLKVDKKKDFMIIEIAFNSEYVDFSIANGMRIRTNNSELISKTQRTGGKVLITVKNPTSEFIYLNIFRKNEEQNNLLYNYVFKYINVEKEEDFFVYKILSNDNSLTIEETPDKEDKELVTIKCTFNKIDLEKGKANITYFFKVVENSTHIYGESYETIAVMESPYYTIYKRNPDDSNGKITLTAEGHLTNWAYLQVIAQIQQDTILDYVAYKGVKNIRPSEGSSSNDKSNNKKSGPNITLFAVIMVVLILLVAGLAITVAIIQKKNKGLVEQVKHISFQQNQNAGADPDLLLNKN